MALLVNEQLQQTKKWKLEYGEKTLVLTQVGSFYESYALKDATTGLIYGSNIEEFAAINEMVVAQKGSTVGKDHVMMAGVGVPYIEPYIKKMLDHHYTLVMYKQEIDDKKNITRPLAEIISPGTYIGIDHAELSNNMVCVWLHYTPTRKSFPATMTIGLSNVDVFTGKTALQQTTVLYQPDSSTYDQLERHLTTYNPNECIFITNLSFAELKDVQKYVGLNNDTKVHLVSFQEKSSPSSSLATSAQNAEKQMYQQETLRRFFPTYTYEINDEYNLATQAFCVLLSFVAQHNPHLVKKLVWPETSNQTETMLLANHSLAQLNIIDDGKEKGTTRSISALLNKCVTKMGQRQFLFLLNNPTTSNQTLEASYEMTTIAMKSGLFTPWRTALQQLHQDFDKFSRRLLVQKVTPHDIALLVADLKIIGQIYSEHTIDPVIRVALLGPDAPNVQQLCDDLIKATDKIFKLESMLGVKAIDGTTECFVQRGISTELDKVMQNSVDGCQRLEAIRAYLSSFCLVKGKSNDGVKLHETAKSQAILIGTASRINTIKRALEKLGSTTEVTLSYQSLYTLKSETFSLDLSHLSYESHGTNNVMITSAQIRSITSDNQFAKTAVVTLLQNIFKEYLSSFQDKYETDMATIIMFVKAVDLLQCKCYLAQKYNYCRPDIGKGSGAILTFTGLRHPLIEVLQTNETYVTNDLALDADNARGILLYGTNAVGKTSFIKAVGIAVILAQAGFYVPCSTFAFTPYKAIFTRILGNDNLFKGLSTFAVEMSELRTILTSSDEHSLVLGDELCSGTESSSALSIFMTGIEELFQKKATFLFATHFHEIAHYDELRALTANGHVKLMHMAVQYDVSRKRLIYDRKLRDGAGENMYGLEVCKSLNLPPTFLERAHAIRLKYDTKQKQMNVLNQLPSHYNAKKIKSICELCRDNVASEIHHLSPQKDAREDNGYISSVHKNHPANLIGICNDCHHKIHDDNIIYKISKTVEDGQYVLVRV